METTVIVTLYIGDDRESQNISLEMDLPEPIEIPSSEQIISTLAERGIITPPISVMQDVKRKRIFCIKSESVNVEFCNASIKYLSKLSVNAHSALLPEQKLSMIKCAIALAEDWCKDQGNGMTEGEVCMSALKDIRRIIK